MTEKCIPSALIKKGIKKFTCLRSDGQCCQAICNNGSQCQNKATYKLPLGKIPLLGGTVSAFTCQKLSFVPVKKSDCCGVCTLHAKRSTLFVFKYASNKLCTYVVNKVVNGMVKDMTGSFSSLKQADQFFGMVS